MREMKDSGIEWINVIPKDWRLNRIQYCLMEVKVNNSPIQTEQVLSLVKDVGVMLYEEKGDVGNKAKADVSEYKLAYPNTLIVNSMNILIGSVGISNYFGCVSPVYYVFREKEDTDLRFINYIFNTREFQKELRKYANGILEIRLRVSANDIFKRLIPLPSKKEQIAIADYLDAKCSEIDNLSADIQSEIDTLEAFKRSVITEAVTRGLDKNAEVKNSEVFYMAPYNVSWRLSKIGYECTKLSRSFKPEDAPLLCTNKGKVSIRPEEMSGRMVSEDNAMQGIHKGDIAIHGMDTWHGAIALSEYNGKITRVVHVCDSHNDKRFIVYYLQQLAFNGVYKLISNGVRGNTSDFRSWDKVGDIYIALPSVEDQTKIADYLESMSKQVESIISQKKEQIEVLADYKKSVIYEYVTGKKEVPSNE